MALGVRHAVSILMVRHPQTGSEPGKTEGGTDNPERMKRHVPVTNRPPQDYAFHRDQQPGDRHDPADAAGVLRHIEISL